MQTSFHATLARAANYHATMIIEPHLTMPFGIDAQNILVRNMKSGHMEAAMNVADALVRSVDPTRQIFRGYCYDQVMHDVGDAVITRSAHRAAGSIPEGAVVEGPVADTLRNAIAAELSYLFLKACERFYEALGSEPVAA